MNEFGVEKDLSGHVRPKASRASRAVCFASVPLSDSVDTWCRIKCTATAKTPSKRVSEAKFDTAWSSVAGLLSQQIRRNQEII